MSSLPSALCTHSLLLGILAMLQWWFMGGWQRDQGNCQPWTWQLCRTVTHRVWDNGARAEVQSEQLNCCIG